MRTRWLAALMVAELAGCARSGAPLLRSERPPSVPAPQRQTETAIADPVISPAQWTPLRWQNGDPECFLCDPRHAKPKLLFPQCPSPVLERADGNILYVKDGARRLAPRRMGGAALFPFGRSARTLLPGTVIAYYPIGSDRYRFLLSDGHIAESEQVFGEAKAVGQPLPPRLVQAVIGKRAVIAMTRDRLFRSHDGMAHWQEIQLDYARPSPYRVERLQMNARGEGVLHLSPERVYRTVDDGETWQRVASLGQQRKENLLYTTSWNLDPAFGRCDEPPRSLSSCGPATLLDDGWACLAADAERYLVVVTHGDDQSKIVPWPVANCRPRSLSAHQSTLWISCIEKPVETGLGRYPGPDRLFYSNDDGARFTEDSGPLIGDAVDWRAGPGGSLITIVKNEIQWRPGRRVLTEKAPAWIGLGTETVAAAFENDPPGLWTLAQGADGLVLKQSPIDLAQFVDKRTLGTPALAKQVSKGVGELTFLEVTKDEVGVVLNTPDQSYYHFDSANKIWEFDYSPLGPRAGATGRRMLSRQRYGRVAVGNVIGESNDGGHTFYPFRAYGDYYEAECNRAGCLVEDAYRRGWDLPRGAPVVIEQESHPRLERPGPLLQCNSLAGAPKTIEDLLVLQPKHRGDALIAGVSTRRNGHAILHTLDRRGTHATHELLRPSREHWTKDDYGETVRTADNGVVYRYRSLGSIGSEESASSEIEWAYLEWPTQRVWRGRRRVPIPGSWLEFTEITPWQDWAVLTAGDRQIVIPADPRQAPYFTREGKPKFTREGKPQPRCGQCSGPVSPDLLFMKDSAEPWGFWESEGPTAEALVSDSGFSWNMGQVSADRVVRDGRIGLYMVTTDESALAVWDLPLSQISSTRPEPNVLALPPDPSSLRVCPSKLTSGARLEVPYQKWTALYGDTNSSQATVTFRSTTDGLCAESLELEFALLDEHVFVRLADPGHSIAFAPYDKFLWHPVRCKPVGVWAR